MTFSKKKRSLLGAFSISQIVEGYERVLWNFDLHSPSERPATRLALQLGQRLDQLFPSTIYIIGTAPGAVSDRFDRNII